jgi:hypothetical protein
VGSAAAFQTSFHGGMHVGEDTADIATGTTTAEIFQGCLSSVGGLIYCSVSIPTT